MNIPSFFSCIISGMMVSGLGFSTFSKGEESLPYVGAILDSEMIEQTIRSQLQRQIPMTIGSADFSEEYQKLPCASTLFPNISSWEENTEDEYSSEVTVDVSSSLQGCLSVWWNLESYQDDNHQIRTGNVLWGMSGTQRGTIFLSKLTLSGSEITAEDEVLYYLKRDNEYAPWKVEYSTNEGLDYSEIDTEDEEGSEGVSITPIEYDWTNLENGWDTQTAPEGQLDWLFVASGGMCQNCQKAKGWGRDIGKWLQKRELLETALTSYTDIGGKFYSGQESWPWIN